MPQKVRDKISKSSKGKKRKLKSTLKMIETRKKNGTWFSKEMLDKIRETKIKNGSFKRSKITKKRIGVANKGKKRSEEVRVKMSLAHTKELEFIDFKTKLQKRIRKTLEYSNWRKQVFERDSYICKNPNCIYCNNVKGGNLEAHHEIPVRECIALCWEEEIFDIDNGQTFCEDYHKSLSNYN